MIRLNTVRAFRRLWKVRRRLLPVRRGAVVLAYHRVSDPSTAPGGDPWNNCVALDRFASHMEVVSSLGCAVPLEEIADLMAAGESPGRRIAVTFDDGYLDNLTNALPILLRHNIPATVFFVAGDPGGVFWWDRLAGLLERADPALSFRIRRAGGSFEWRGKGSTKKLGYELLQFLHKLGGAERMTALEQLYDTWKVEASVELPRTMTDREAQALFDSGLVEPGGHTIDHPALASVSAERARTEINVGRKLLQTRFGRSVSSFAYPHSSAGPLTGKMVREAGYRLACLLSNAPVTASTDLMRVPRVWVEDHWTTDEFQHRIGRYLAEGAT